MTVQPKSILNRLLSRVHDKVHTQRPGQQKKKKARSWSLEGGWLGYGGTVWVFFSWVFLARHLPRSAWPIRLFLRAITSKYPKKSSGLRCVRKFGRVSFIKRGRGNTNKCHKLTPIPLPNPTRPMGWGQSVGKVLAPSQV